MRESLSSADGVAPGSSFQTTGHLNRDSHLDNSNDFRYNEGTQYYIISDRFKGISSLDDARAKKDRTVSEGFGVHRPPARSAHLPSAEILRLFHQRFPDICLFEDTVGCSASLPQGEYDRLEIHGEDFHGGHETIWQAFGGHSHDTYDVPDTVDHTNSYQHPSMYVPCTWTMEDDPSSCDELEEYVEVNPMPLQWLLSWTCTCAPAA